MSDPDHSELPTEAVLAAQSGRKVRAVKILREQTGMGLTEAKSVVDRIVHEHRRAAPRMKAGREDSGLLRLIAVVLVLGAVAAAFLLL